MSAHAVHGMTNRLTIPFGRGADTLPLSLTAVGADRALVDEYDFERHRALFGRLPEPRYVLTTLVDVGFATTVRVTFIPAAGSPATIVVPAGSLAGSSFVVETPGSSSPELHLLDLRVDPVPVVGVAADLWRLDALLGNLAKVLWVIGWEKDALRRQGERVQAQRRLRDAMGPSLDRLGADLAVPRFPPLPYGFDPAANTVALYHLDDRPANGSPEVDTVEDAMTRYDGAGHPGINVNRLARSRATGRFGRDSAARQTPGRAEIPLAFDFADPNAEIAISDHADFALDATASFTIECFLKPNRVGGSGVVLSKLADPGDAIQAGWALSVGEFGRGIFDNPRFLLSDGTKAMELFADVRLMPDRFAHLAATVDRVTQEARLYVDGVLRRTASLSEPEPTLSTLTNARPLRIGHAAGGPDPLRPGQLIGDAYPGVIDEVRISRAALRVFTPVLGEADEAYRRRLRLFERWTLPTPENLERLLNEAVGTIDEVAAPLIVDDVDTTLLSGSLPVTVDLADLTAGECIDAAGQRRVREADVCGIASDDADFDPDFLIERTAGPRITFAPPPVRELLRGELPPSPRKMQLVVDRQLDVLLALLADDGAIGALHVLSAFDPRASDLRAVGRGVLIRHTGVLLDRLAALAHNAGFAFVCHQPELGAIYASMPVGNQLEITITGGSASGADGVAARVGETLELSMRPIPPAGTRYSWRTVACGHGRAELTSVSAAPAITLEATVPGSLVVIGEATRNHHTAVGANEFRIGLLELDDGAAIGADGSRSVSEEKTDRSDAPFHPIYLVTRDDTLADYGVEDGHRRMQPAVSDRFDRLIHLAAEAGAGGHVEVLAAYEAGSASPAGTGLALRLRHSTLPAGRLGALAHAAGFTMVRREADVIQVQQRPEDLVTITGLHHVQVGESIPLSAAPRAAPHGLAATATAIYTVNHGTDSVSEIERETGRIVRAVKVGRGPVAAVVNPDGTRLYTADGEGNTVTVVDLASGDIVGAIATDDEPVSLVHHPTAPRLYVGCAAGATLTRVDTETRAVIDSLALGGGAIATTIRPDGAEVWLARAAAAVEVIDAAAMILLATIPLTADPGGIAVRPDGATAYVTLPASGELVLLDVASRTVETVSIGGMPAAVTVAPDGASVFVVDQTDANESLRVLEPDGAPRASVRIRRAPAAVVAVAEQVYVVNAGSDDVSVIAVTPDGADAVDGWPLGSGLGEQLTWVVRSAGPARADLSSTTVPAVELLGKAAGAVRARVVYAQPGQAAPYTFEVRLRPELAATDAVIRKDQYDLIMNILNAFHPIGVEVTTRAIRERVIEVRDALLDAFPDYTYPRFRVRHVLPPLKREE